MHFIFIATIKAGLLLCRPYLLDIQRLLISYLIHVKRMLTTVSICVNHIHTHDSNLASNIFPSIFLIFLHFSNPFHLLFPHNVPHSFKHVLSLSVSSSFLFLANSSGSTCLHYIKGNQEVLSLLLPHLSNVNVRYVCVHVYAYISIYIYPHRTH